LQGSLKGYEAYNLGTGNGTSVLELVAAFERISGIEIPLNKKARRPGDAEKLLAIPTKANETLKWRADMTIDDMCRDTWNWVRNNPNGYEE
jgi:UDP-glucose 4-epimerase